MKTRHCTFRLLEVDVEYVEREIARLGWEGTLSYVMRAFLSRLAADLRAARSDKRKIEILRGKG